MEHEGDGDTNRYWRARYDQKEIDKGTRGLGNKWTIGDHSKYGMVEIGQNTEKSLGDLRRLAVTQTPVKNHQM